MKIVHLMCGEKFTVSVASFYDKYFNNGEHEILYVNTEGNRTLKIGGLHVTQKEIFLSKRKISSGKALFRAVEAYDYVVFHSFFINDYYKFLWGRKKKLCKKTVWIAWGFDLYSCFLEKPSLIGRIKNSINQKIRDEIGSVVGIFPPDCEYFQEKFPTSKAKVYYAPYCGNKTAETYKKYEEGSRLSADNNAGDPIYVQVGHNALPTLRHLDVLERLSKYKDENVRIFLPLSYPKNEYADAVQKRAEELFGEKAICLREMMPREDYFALVDRVSIAIFNAERQCGLGNIKHMLLKNVKLYMPQESVMSRYFVENGAPIQAYERLGEESFEEFITEKKPNEKAAFEEFINGFSDMKKNVAYWKAIYDDLKLRLDKDGQ